MALGPVAARSRSRSRARARALVVVALLAAVAVAVLLTRGPGALLAPVAGDANAPAADVFAYAPDRAGQYTERAVAGDAHVLFSDSPGGALATAARVAALRPLIDRAAAGSGIDPDWLEGLVFVESAGRPDAIAGGDPANAAGLTQILPATATSMLGLRVDLAQSTRLTEAIDDAQAIGAAASKVDRLEAERAQVDERFDPRRALAATVRYLELARAQFGREDLAFVSYHMGIGNLASVLDDYDGGRSVPYVQLYFDSTPARHAAAYAALQGFSDQSALYFWRVLGAAAIMQLYRGDRAALTRLQGLQEAQDSAAEVLHPPDRTPAFADPRALAGGYGDGALVPLPANGAQLGLAYSNQIGALARRLHAPAGLYRGLRPAALDVLLALAAGVGRARAPLVVTSAVTDQRYQGLLGYSDPPATDGYAFTIATGNLSQGQLSTLAGLLERLQALNAAAWAAYPSVLEVTAASDAAAVIAHGP